MYWVMREKYEVGGDEMEKELGRNVGGEVNVMGGLGLGGEGG